MLGLFREVRDFLEFDRIWIDNTVFRLHYKGTVIAFIIASILVS